MNIFIVFLIVLFIYFIPSYGIKGSVGETETLFDVVSKLQTEFNEKLLNISLHNKKTYAVLYDIIKKSKEIDKTKILPFEYEYFRLNDNRPALFGCVFMDKDKNFRLGLEHTFIENEEYKRNCLTLDEIEAKVDFEKLLNGYKKQESKKINSQKEMSRLSNIKRQ